MVDGVNLYMYVRGNPVRLHDPSGNAGALPECDDQIDYNLPNQDVKALPDNPTLGGMRGNANGFFSPDASAVQVPDPSNTSSGPQWVQGPGPGLRERIVKEGGPIALFSLTLYDIADDAYIVAQKVAGRGDETFRLSGEFVSDKEAQDALVNTLTLFIFSGGSSSGRVAEGFADDAAKAMAKESPKSISPKFGKNHVAGDLEKSPAELARAWQGKGEYPGIDNWVNEPLPKGTIVFGGAPGQGNFYTSESALKQIGPDATKLYEGLQVGKSGYPTHRAGMTAYEIPSETVVGSSNALANPQFGAGGLPQYFITNPSDLRPLYTVILRNR